MSTDTQRYERFRRIWALLAGAAARGNTVTYKDVGDEIDLFHRNLAPYLTRIKAYCKDHDLPHLNAICVAGATCLPSDPEYDQNARAIRDQALAYDWRKQPTLPRDFSLEQYWSHLLTTCCTHSARTAGSVRGRGQYAA